MDFISEHSVTIKTTDIFQNTVKKMKKMKMCYAKYVKISKTISVFQQEKYLKLN